MARQLPRVAFWLVPERRVRKVFQQRINALAKRYGAAVVALTINQDGMAMRTAEKVATARAIHDIVVGEFGMRPQDILFDPLTFPLTTGDESLRGDAPCRRIR